MAPLSETGIEALHYSNWLPNQIPLSDPRLIWTVPGFAKVDQIKCACVKILIFKGTFIRT
jgi:hypothetical protein